MYIVRMADSTLWIASLTAGTAVLASWVSGRATARAATIQAGVAADAQRGVRIRETRRAAYVSLIEQAHRMADLYWKVSDVHATSTHTTQIPALQEIRVSLREEYGKLRHLVWIVTLEGPDHVATAAEDLRLTTRPPFRALEASIAGNADAVREFDACYDPFWKSVLAFVAAARTAVHDM